MLEVFLRYRKEDDGALKRICPDLEPKLMEGFKSEVLEGLKAGFNRQVANNLDDARHYQGVMKCMNSLFRIQIGSIELEDAPLNFYVHPYNQDRGLLMGISLDSFPTGYHELVVEKTSTNLFLPDSLEVKTFVVPFWKKEK